MKFRRCWNALYYGVKDWFSPWNVIKLRKLSRSYQEIDTLMEETILQLLNDFFEFQQPFGELPSVGYTHEVSVHRAMLEAAYGETALKENEDVQPPEAREHFATLANRCYPIYSELLDIVEWYRAKGHVLDGTMVYLAARSADVNHEAATVLQREHDRQHTARLVFVIQNRGYLWT